MRENKVKLAIFGILAGAMFFCFSLAETRAMGNISDVISTSWPGYGADHVITVRVAHDIPPSGMLTITPQDSQFFISAGFDHTDVDLATSSSAAGPFIERALGSTSTAEIDGVEVIDGSTQGNIAITLNSSYGISGGEWLRIKLGANAVFGGAGDRQIINPSSPGEYTMLVQSFDGGENFLDRGTAMIAAVEPVSMTAGQKNKIRSNGQPTGYLVYGTTQTIMSLNTNYRANCSYSIASSTPYADMTDIFTFSGAFFHSALLTGLVNGGEYAFFVRCRDEDSVDDDTDYMISFAVSEKEGDEGEEGGGTPGPGGGGSGGGGGGGFGQEEGPGTGDFLPYPPPPGLPGVVFRGWAYPLSVVYILKDGQEEGKVNANTRAEFGAFLADLPRGVYTFGVWSRDSEGRNSVTNSTTFFIEEGTQTTISDIFLPPTIQLARNSALAGESFEIFGQSAPGAMIDAWLYPAGLTDPKEDQAIRARAQAGDDGKWTVLLGTAGAEAGNYKIKAKASREKTGESGFSQPLDCAVGGEAAVSRCAGADLNGDGRVNLTDFSILLYYWGTDDACADQNQDGTVDLIDFSIMMFYWTG